MTDKELRDSVLAALDWEPRLDAGHIGVAVAGGVVTLTGHVSSYAEKMAAEEAVRGVRGVHAIAQEIEVRLPSAKKTADDEIAKRALDIVAWDAMVPDDRIQVKVQHGFVTLTGEVDWQYQRQAAEDAVRKLSGVTGVANLLGVKARVAPSDVKTRIETALKRAAEVEASGIRVNVVDGRVILEGTVRAMHERLAAENAAWAAPGVKGVEDRIQVRPG